MRSTLKTILGLVVIGVVVIATFLYGNSQRQEQLRHDEDLKRAATTVSPKPAASTKPTQITTGGTNAPANGGTKPVATPAQAQSSGQVAGSTIATPTPSPKATGAAQSTITPVAPARQVQPPTTPATGAGLETVVGMTALALAAIALQRSRRSLAEILALPRG